MSASILRKRPLFTLETKMRDVPHGWFKLIEPRIVRPDDTTCWLWTGALDKDGEPVISITANGKRRLIRAKRIIADWFWEIARHIEIVHECGNLNCLNPHHWYLSAAHWTQENREGRVAKKQKAIKDYVNQNNKS